MTRWNRSSWMAGYIRGSQCHDLEIEEAKRQARIEAFSLYFVATVGVGLAFAILKWVKII